MNTSEAFNRYLATNAGKDLLKKHSLDERGVWEIRGEDPNCDLGGYHYSPYLATVQGTLEGAIDAGVTLPGFWRWGAGGSITAVQIVTTEQAKSRAERKGRIEAEISRLQTELDQLS